MRLTICIFFWTKRYLISVIIIIQLVVIYIHLYSLYSFITIRWRWISKHRLWWWRWLRWTSHYWTSVMLIVVRIQIIMWYLISWQIKPLCSQSQRSQWYHLIKPWRPSIIMHQQIFILIRVIYIWWQYLNDTPMAPHLLCVTHINQLTFVKFLSLWGSSL